jgi:4-azaleucine resistance transporter AzlC
MQSHNQPTRQSEFFSGVKAVLPLELGVLPFGLIFGVTVHAASFPPIAAQATSTIIFAGSAQLITARLFGSGVPLLVIVLTSAIINLRHVLYSASIAPYFQSLNRKWKWLLAYLLTDEAYAISILHFEKLENANFIRMRKNWYFFGAGITLWVTWHLSTLIGVFIGGQIPASWGLDFAVPLTFIALVVPVLRERAGIAAAIVASVVSVVAFSMPYQLSLVTAALLGIFAGVAVESFGSRANDERQTTIDD